MRYCILPVWSEIIPIYDIPVVLHNKCYTYFQITYLLNEISNLTIDNVAVHESLLTAKSLNFICRMLGNSGYSNNSSSILTVCVLSFVVIWEQQMPKQAWHNSWVAANSSATHLKQKEKKKTYYLGSGIAIWFQWVSNIAQWHGASGAAGSRGVQSCCQKIDRHLFSRQFCKIIGCEKSKSTQS